MMDSDLDSDLDSDAMAQAMGFASFGAQKPPSSKRRKFNPAADAVVAAPDGSGSSILPPRPRARLPPPPTPSRSASAPAPPGTQMRSTWEASMTTATPRTAP
ncbi:hypothetical protein MN608_01424 [Microdochium nivale]|nr:hypothetical protein MN608_01424 [Microdochium nivale]